MTLFVSSHSTSSTRRSTSSSGSGCWASPASPPSWWSTVLASACLPLPHLLVQAALQEGEAGVRGDGDGEDGGGRLVPALPPGPEY